MSNVLVAYFSASGTTARAAQSLAKAAGAICMKSNPPVPLYSGGSGLEQQTIPQLGGDER